MDNQQSPTAGTPIYQESSQGKNAKWLWLLIALIIIGALAFAVVRGIGPFSALNIGQGEASPTPSPRLSASPSPTPSEASPGAELDKSEPVVRVSNGSGTAGVASTMRDFLENLGYSVASVGNAENFDFENTTIRLKEGFEEFELVLEEELSDDYSVVVDNTPLDDTDDADIEVIVGAK